MRKNIGSRIIVYIVLMVTLLCGISIPALLRHPSVQDQRTAMRLAELNNIDAEKLLNRKNDRNSWEEVIQNLTPAEQLSQKAIEDLTAQDFPKNKSKGRKITLKEYGCSCRIFCQCLRFKHQDIWMMKKKNFNSWPRKYRWKRQCIFFCILMIRKKIFQMQWMNIFVVCSWI